MNQREYNVDYWKLYDIQFCPKCGKQLNLDLLCLTPYKVNQIELNCDCGWNLLIAIKNNCYNCKFHVKNPPDVINWKILDNHCKYGYRYPYEDGCIYWSEDGCIYWSEKDE